MSAVIKKKFNPLILRGAHRHLHEWYQAHGRHDLPWRKTSDPYAIYISEIMLQQTQVKTVLERFYYPFLERFPTLQALAAAPEQEVLKAWEGLGYYSRALNMHKAAKQCGGTLPDNIETLLTLPGIGRNTAHAVAAFAYRQPAAVMEANVKRILHRIFALETADTDTLFEKAEKLLDRKNPFDYNQAMMDIGATICTPRAPACILCPLEKICLGKDHPHAYPAAQKKKKAPIRKRTIMVTADGKGRYLVQPRTTKFLQGLYGFPEYPPSGRENSLSRLQERAGVRAACSTKYLGTIRQSYSHFTLEAKVYIVKTDASRPEFKTLEQITQLPKSKADEKVLALLAANA